MARKGLGKGLDSLIPDFYNEDFDSNSPQSLEDMLKENEDTQQEAIIDEIEEEDEVNDQENSKIQDDEQIGESFESSERDKETPMDQSEPEDLPGDKGSQETVQTSQEIQIQKEHVEEVKAIVDKNPRITLWSSRSSAVFRYLRKTEPEFSISKEASILIDEAVSKKYPEIWKLFEE